MKPIDFMDEDRYGSAKITFSYNNEHTDGGVYITSPGQTISGERLLKAAGYLIQAYAKSKNINIKKVKIITDE